MARVSGAFIIGLVIAGVGAIFHIVGMASYDWASIERDGSWHATDNSFGLFKECDEEDCASFPHLTGAQMATQATAILGCLMGVAGIGMATMYVVWVVRGRAPRAIFRIISGFCCFFAKIFIAICVIVFRAEIYEHLKYDTVVLKLGYGFYCSSLGGFLFLVAGIVKMAAWGYEVEKR